MISDNEKQLFFLFENMINLSTHLTSAALIIMNHSGNFNEREASGQKHNKTSADASTALSLQIKKKGRFSFLNAKSIP